MRDDRSRNGLAVGALILGLLSLAAVPAAIAYTHYADVQLLKAGFAVPFGLILGVAALSLAKRARRRSERTIGRIGGIRAARAARLLGGLGLYVALVGALAVGVYELLNRLSG